MLGGNKMIKTAKSTTENEKENFKGTKCEVYSRVVGYHRPIDNWNEGKKEEFDNRFLFSTDE
jgi:anaerobic ribonucleoside-triphosphate reductase